MLFGALEGLHAAHEARDAAGDPLELVHRDISPHNILVGTDGIARVLDFGVAKARGRAQTTRVGQLKGKLAYMAPEQLRGNVEPAHATSSPRPSFCGRRSRGRGSSRGMTKGRSSTSSFIRRSRRRVSTRPS